MKTPTAGPTKNGKTRWVDVGADLGIVLDRIAAERPKLALKHTWRPVPPWMFVTASVYPYDQANVGKDFRRILRLAGLANTGLSCHSMRHTFACLHIANGKNPEWIQQQLGHSSIKITYDVYGDWFQLYDTRAADDLAASFLGNKTGNSECG